MGLDPDFRAPDGQPSFRALPGLETDEVGDVLQAARVRILRYLARRGVVRLLPEALEVDDELATPSAHTKPQPNPPAPDRAAATGAGPSSCASLSVYPSTRAFIAGAA
jgi:hypothetical protein